MEKQFQRVSSRPNNLYTQGFIQDFIKGGVSKNQGVTHGYTRDLLTYVLLRDCGYL